MDIHSLTLKVELLIGKNFLPDIFLLSHLSEKCIPDNTLTIPPLSLNWVLIAF